MENKMGHESDSKLGDLTDCENLNFSDVEKIGKNISYHV
jgi:hypothetical protein